MPLSCLSWAHSAFLWWILDCDYCVIVLPGPMCVDHFACHIHFKSHTIYSIYIWPFNVANVLADVAPCRLLIFDSIVWTVCTKTTNTICSLCDSCENGIYSILTLGYISKIWLVTFWTRNVQMARIMFFFFFSVECVFVFAFQHKHINLFLFRCNNDWLIWLHCQFHCKSFRFSHQKFTIIIEAFKFCCNIKWKIRKRKSKWLFRSKNRPSILIQLVNSTELASFCEYSFRFPKKEMMTANTLHSVSSPCKPFLQRMKRANKE